MFEEVEGVVGVEERKAVGKDPKGCDLVSQTGDDG